MRFRHDREGMYVGEICPISASHALKLFRLGPVKTIFHLSIGQNLLYPLGNMPHVYYMCDTYVVHVWCFGVLHM